MYGSRDGVGVRWGREEGSVDHEVSFMKFPLSDLFFTLEVCIVSASMCTISVYYTVLKYQYYQSNQIKTNFICMAQNHN